MTLENIDKKQVQADLVTHLGGSVVEDHQEVAMRRTDAEPVREDEHRVDDVSHQDEAGDVHALFQEVDERQKKLVTTAKGLDMAARTTVEPGAIIELDGERFVVGVASDEFTSGGATYSGLSTDAPVYQTFAGKTSGESAETNGHAMTLGDIV